MTPRSTMMITILIFLLVGILRPAPVDGTRKPCCTRYSTLVVATEHIRGFREQTNLGHCRLRAIILYTTTNHEICVNPNDAWVKKALNFLSSKLKMMSKNTVNKNP